MAFNQVSCLAAILRSGGGLLSRFNTSCKYSGGGTASEGDVGESRGAR
jgi:hypothetical protein